MTRSNDTTVPPNPTGLCRCGCGGITRRAKKSDHRYGWVAGEHVPYINRHARRNAPQEYIVEDRGYEGGPCWIWQRGKSSNGYGTIKRNGRITGAHRAYYQEFVGPIPDGLVIDHLCRQRDCVNPNHLQPVSCRINLLRGANPSSKAARENTCMYGHPLTPDNVHYFPNGRRTCRICLAKEYERARQRDAARKAKAA